MDMEQTLEAIRTSQEAWAAFTQSILNTAKALSEMLDAIFSDPKLYPERNGTPPKKYGMSLRKRPYKTLSHYHYIPVTPRNRPYQRRAY